MNPLIKFVLIATAAVTFLLAGAGALLGNNILDSPGAVRFQDRPSSRASESTNSPASRGHNDDGYAEI